MKTFALTLAATALTASVATAASVANYDANGDRFASFTEVTAVNPGFSKSDFRAVDTNSDNRLSAVEVQSPGASAILARGQSSGSIKSIGEISGGGSFASQAQLMAAYPGLSVHDFNEIDQNNDGRVSSNELYDADAHPLLRGAADEALVSLDVIDTDGSNFASLSELQAQYPTLTKIDFRRVDLNNDSRLSFSELYRIEAQDVIRKNQ